MKNKMYSAIVTVLTLTIFLNSSVAQAIEIRSQDYGGLLSIDEAISRTVKDHAKVKEAIARLEKEKALYQGSRAEFFPKFGTEFFAAASTGGKRSVSYFDTTLEQPLFQGGKSIYGKRKQKVIVEAEGLRLDQQKTGLMLEVRIIYAQALREKEMLRLSQNAVKVISRSRDWFKALYERELITPFEFSRMETLAAKAKEQTVKSKETYDYLLAVLKQVMGIEDEEAIDLEAINDLPDIQSSVESYLELARTRNPVYKITELAVKEKQLEKKILQADRYPQISLGVKWDVYNDTFVDNNRVMAGVLGKWDIWDFGRLNSKIAAKSHEIDEVRWASKAKIDDEEKEINRLFHEARAMKEKIRMFDVELAEKAEQLKNEKSRLIAGQKAEPEILDAYLDLQRSHADHIEAVTEYRILVSKLECWNDSREGVLDE